MNILNRPSPIKHKLKRKDYGGIISWRNRFDELHKPDGPALVRDKSFRDKMSAEDFYLPVAEWYQNGARHRIDGPAVIYDMEDAFFGHTPLWEYWVSGKLHRTQGPARVFARGEEWYREGMLHRTDGPAVTRSAEDPLRPIYEYYKEGYLHRMDGPAVIYPEHKEKDIPLEEYWIEGELYRDDGPVIVWRDGESWNRKPSWHIGETSL